MQYLIYKHENEINGKIYIGQTCQIPERKWRANGKGYVDCPKFYKPIEKYGWENFSHDIIEVVNSQEEANEREIYWIKYYNSFYEGYNATIGGNNYMHDLWQDKEYSNKMKIAFSNSRKKQWENEKYANSIKEKLVTGLKVHWNDKEWRTNRIQFMLNENNSNAKIVININTGKEFSCIKEAANWCGLKDKGHSIGECCKGKQKTAGFSPKTGERLKWREILGGDAR